MRYKRERKKETHGRIVAEAARLFREEGFDGCGVDAVMRAAGLTAGGFYAHFADKDGLLAEAIGACVCGPVRSVSEDDAEFARKMVDQYLSSAHRDAPGTGCPLPALAADVARQPMKVRRAFTAQFRKAVEMLAGRLPGEDEGERFERALAVFAAAAGAVLIARAVSDRGLSERILEVMRGRAGEMVGAAKASGRAQAMSKRTLSRRARRPPPRGEVEDAGVSVWNSRR